MKNKHLTPRTSTHTREREFTEVFSPPSQVPELAYLSPAVSVIYKYGIPRSAALNMLHNYWSISSSYRNLFSIYYILHWDAGYFRQELKEGMLEREGVRYQVIYHRCDSYNIGKGTGELLLSFRSLVSDYEATPTVLVTIA